MDTFLNESKAALSDLSVYKKVRVIMGNSTCDLDSAVSALVRGFSEYLDAKKSGNMEMLAISLMNIPEREFRTKTEVVYYLERNGIPSNLLTFRDQLDLRAVKNDPRIDLEVILVDHHCLPEEEEFLTDSVIEIIDHRPRDKSWLWEGRSVHIESVGSCATLVALNFLKKHPEMLDARLSNILQGPILIDTCNFSKEADRATPIDFRAMDALEQIEGANHDRKKTFDEIVTAKADISRLSPDDLLIRDLKVTTGIPIVGLPLLVEKFLTLEKAFDAIKAFAASKNTTAVVLMGLELKSEKVTRDIAVFSLSNNHLKDKIEKMLTTSTEPSLDLNTPREIKDNENGNYTLVHYRQGNLRASRKQILPMIRDAASQCHC